jgi:uncharacterized protein YbaR (Trm112 family)
MKYLEADFFCCPETHKRLSAAAQKGHGHPVKQAFKRL